MRSSFQIYLSLFSEILSPDVISSALELQCDEKTNKGDPTPSPREPKPKAKSHRWTVKTPVFVEWATDSDSIGQRVEELMLTMDAKLARLRTMYGDSSFECEVFCYIWRRETKPDMFFEWRTLELLARNRIDVNFWFWNWDEDVHLLPNNIDRMNTR